MNIDRNALERWWVVLVALHSFGVGVVLMFFPHWATGFGGWDALDDVFFVRQGGAFHFVVAAGYLLEYRRHRTVSLLVTAKSLATVFLFVVWFSDLRGPWAVPLSGLADGLMLTVTLLILRARGSNGETGLRR